MTLAAGTRLGPYEIVSPLGAGGMGEVYKARDTRLGRDVAIKVLPAEVAGDADRLLRFEREARAASALNHPNILTVHDVGNEAGVSFLVTELLHGESLRESLSAGPLPARRVVEIATQVAHGLAAAHEKGIVHRDLKPENIFLPGNGPAKILDFGLARWEVRAAGTLSEAPTMAESTAAGVMLGTVGYMAPEQVRGERADARVRADDVVEERAGLYQSAAQVARSGLDRDRRAGIPATRLRRHGGRRRVLPGFQPRQRAADAS